MYTHSMKLCHAQYQVNIINLRSRSLFGMKIGEHQFFCILATVISQICETVLVYSIIAYDC